MSWSAATDLQQNVIALWHDESQLNRRYAAERSDYRPADPGLLVPGGAAGRCR